MLEMRRFIVGLCIKVLILAAMCTPVAAQPYPAKLITIVVPFAAGGSIDVLARLISRALNESLDVPVVVVNRVGAMGVVGYGSVAKAAPDGATLMLTSTSLTLTALVEPKFNFDAVKDFSPISAVAFSPFVLLTRPDFNSLNDLIRYAKENPGAVNYASTGIGGAAHLTGEMLALATNTKLFHVPYNGAAPALNDVLAGTIQMFFTTYISGGTLLKSGKVRGLAIASNSRLVLLPDVPTFAELGYKDLEVGTMFGLFAPPRLPETLKQRIYTELKQTLEKKQYKDIIIAQGGQMVMSSPSAFIEHLNSETKRWKGVLNSVGGIKLQ